MKEFQTKTYYWYCCGSKKILANSLSSARELLESHEKEFHFGKLVGTFGVANEPLKENEIELPDN